MRASDIIRLLALAVDILDSGLGGKGARKGDEPVAPPEPKRQGTKWGLSEEAKAFIAEGEKRRERDARFRKWYWGKEGRRVADALAYRVYEAASGIPDAIYVMSDGFDFTISSASAGATLTGKVDWRSGFTGASLERTDGRSRYFVQGISGLGDFDARLEAVGEGPFDEDERLAAALLRNNPRPGWPGRAFGKTAEQVETLARAVWDALPTGAQDAVEPADGPAPAPYDWRSTKPISHHRPARPGGYEASLPPDIETDEISVRFYNAEGGWGPVPARHQRCKACGLAKDNCPRLDSDPIPTAEKIRDQLRASCPRSSCSLQ